MKRQKGAHTVEFALAGALFFVLLFAVIEFGRALFVWNALTEATRRGARLAVVCPENHPSIASVAVFNTPDAGPGASPVVAGLESGMVSVDYPDGYARVRISGYQHALLIPYFYQTLAAPEFQTTLPRESMGCVPDGNGDCEFRCP
jgi:hypothetical protein